MSFTQNKQTANWVGRFLVPMVFISAVVTNAGCATVQEMSAESKPYGEQLKERVAQWDEWCKKEKLGPYLEDPKKKHITTCDFLALKDKRWDPNADEFSRYAHSIKLPAPYDKPQAQYKEGMTSKQYFEELCAKEAGQWIFKKAQGVQGVLQARPKFHSPKDMNQLTPHAGEIVSYSSSADLHWTVLDSKSTYPYKFVEYQGTPSNSGDASIYRFYRTLEDLRAMEPGIKEQWRDYLSLHHLPYVVSNEVRSHYGYLGRGIARPEFFDHGIVGTELIVFDIRSKEVLGLVRDFSSVRPLPKTSNGLSKQTISLSCPNSSKLSSVYAFLPQLLIQN